MFKIPKNNNNDVDTTKARTLSFDQKFRIKANDIDEIPKKYII